MQPRVLHVLPSLNLGGAERMLVDLVARTADVVAHTVVQLGGAETLRPQLVPFAARIENLRWSGRRDWLRASRAIARIALEQRSDIIQSAMFDANVAARGARAFGARAQWVTNVVSLEYDPETIRLGGYSPHRVRALQTLDAVSAAATKTTFVACSRSVAESTRKRLLSSRVMTIYNAVEPERLKATHEEAARFRDSLGVPRDAFLFLTVSRLAAAKGHNLLLQAFARVSHRLPGAWLVFVGGGPLREELEAQAGRLRLDRFRFGGQPERVGVPLRAASAFVFPSLIEGLSLALVEAALAGVPVLASDIAPNLEVVRPAQTGLVFRRDSVESLADCLVEAAGAPERLQVMARAAQAYAESTFVAESVFPRWLRLYETLSGRKSPR